MKKLATYCLLAAIGLSLVFTSCKKDEDEVKLPVVAFQTGTGYIDGNTVAGYGDTLLFGLRLESNGEAALVKLKITMNGQTKLDSTFNQMTFNMDYTAIKGLDNKETWNFEVTDLDGNIRMAGVEVTAVFGQINTYNSITLGAQENTLTASFLSFSGGTYTLYFQADAFNHQADIDLFCFYEDTPSHQNFMTLASPGSNISGIFTGPTAPENYTVKNITWFCETTVTPAEFDAIANDAMLLASFDPSNKFKKANELSTGNIYAFRTQSGKTGMFRVKSVTNGNDGLLEIAVKIQQ